MTKSVFDSLQGEKEVEHQLFRLFYNENDIQSLNQEIANKKKEVQKIEAKKDKAEEVLRDRKKEQGKIARELAKIEQEVREVVRVSLLNMIPIACVLLHRYVSGSGNQ